MISINYTQFRHEYEDKDDKKIEKDDFKSTRIVRLFGIRIYKRTENNSYIGPKDKERKVGFLN
jgi:hypothetical protein